MNNLFSYAHMKVSVYLCIYVGFVNMHLLEVSTKHAFVCLLVYMQRVSCMRGNRTFNMTLVSASDVMPTERRLNV